MSNNQAGALGDISVSPYLSFRQAVRPAIFAHSLVLREQERAGELADMANQILALTRELLRNAGLGYIATPGPDAAAGAGGGLGRQDSLLDAFADAAMMWAQIMGGCVTLADGLLIQGRLDEARTLAVVMEDSGEAGTARDLHQRLAAAAMDKHKKRLGAIHARMKPKEIENAIDGFAEALTEIPESRDRDIWLNSFLPVLATSTLAHVNGALSGVVRNIAMGAFMHAPDNVAATFSYIAAEFKAAETPDQ